MTACNRENNLTSSLDGFGVLLILPRRTRGVNVGAVQKQLRSRKDQEAVKIKT
jgi:hypothetical protein